MASTRRLCFLVLIAILTSVFVLSRAASAGAATLLTAEKASQVVALENLTIKEGAVSGDLLNKSGRVIRDVQLQIRYSWRWKNEYRPKEDNLGDTVLHTVEKEISPGGKVSFSYRPASSLPSRPDGYFETTVAVAGFTEIIR